MSLTMGLHTKHNNDLAAAIGIAELAPVFDVIVQVGGWVGGWDIRRKGVCG